MTQKSLLIIFVTLFALSACFLFWRNERELDPNQGKSWWTISFTTLDQTENLAFTVDNHSDATHFDYEIITNKKSLLNESFIVAKGNSITITPDISATPDARTTIIVTTGTEKKEIYR